MAASSVPKRAANLGWALVFLAPLLMLDDFVPVTGFFDKSLWVVLKISPMNPHMARKKKERKNSQPIFLSNTGTHTHTDREKKGGFPTFPLMFGLRSSFFLVHDEISGLLRWPQEGSLHGQGRVSLGTSRALHVFLFFGGRLVLFVAVTGSHGWSKHFKKTVFDNLMFFFVIWSWYFGVIHKLMRPAGGAACAGGICDARDVQKWLSEGRRVVQKRNHCLRGLGNVSCVLGSKLPLFS